MLFKVHRHFFQQYSQTFAKKYLRHIADNQPTERGVNQTPIVLEDTTVIDFERFLTIFYPK